MWRRLRIAILLVILLFVALNTYFDRVYSTDWNIPLRIAAYPINADGREYGCRTLYTPILDEVVMLVAFGVANPALFASYGN